MRADDSALPEREADRAERLRGAYFFFFFAAFFFAATISPPFRIRVLSRAC